MLNWILIKRRDTVGKFAKGAEAGFDAFVDMVKNGKSILDGMSNVKDRLSSDDDFDDDEDDDED